MSKESFKTVQLLAEASVKEFSQGLDKLHYLDASTKLVICEIHRTQILSGFGAFFELLESSGINIVMKEYGDLEEEECQNIQNLNLDDKSNLN
jgi:hypothetical protein